MQNQVFAAEFWALQHENRGGISKGSVLFPYGLQIIVTEDQETRYCSVTHPLK